MTSAPRLRGRLFASLAALGNLGTAAACAAGPADVAALRERLDALPRDLRYELALVGEGRNMSRALAVYDMPGQRFMFVTAGEVSVWTADRFYSGKAVSGGLDEGIPTPRWVGQLAESAGRYFPAAWGDFVRSYPERVDSVEPVGEGWRATLRIDSAVEDRPEELIEVQFDPGGIVRRVHPVGQAKPNEYAYSADYPASWMVISRSSVSSLFPGFAVERVLARQTGAESERLGWDEMERLAVEADTDVEHWPSAKLNAVRRERGLSPVLPAPNIRRGIADARGEYTPWRRPLIIGGAALVAVAAYGWLRRRAA